MKFDVYKNPYGDFVGDGREFKITERDIPRNWFNYMWNDDYMAFISHVGRGEAFAQGYLGKRANCIKSRKVYLSDGEEFWSLDGLPVERELQKYECIHSLGSTDIHIQYKNIETSFKMYVPEKGFSEVWLINIKNNDTVSKKLRLTSYTATDVDDPYTYQGYNYGTVVYNKDINALVMSCVTDFTGKFRPAYQYMSSSEPVTGYDTRHNTFIGVYDNEMYPRALKIGKLENNDAHVEKCCLALENTIELMPGEEKNISVVCGFHCDFEKAKENIEKLNTFEKASAEFIAVKKYFEAAERNVTIETPDKVMDKMWNNWAKHATVMGSHWARVRHTGIRDTLNDCWALSSFNPELAYEKLKRILRFQYSNGFAPRTVRDGKIQDNNYADNAVWIAAAVRDTVAELGDKRFLLEEVEFNDGTKASVYEHAKRSVDFLYNFKGMYGLIKIWGGDWNDCMNMAGLEGRGVSVWLSIAWCWANDAFCELAEYMGCEDDVELSKERGREMRALINEYGWDGEYYLTAYTDEGIKIGTHEDSEGKIFLIPQIWAIIAGVCDEERKKILQNSIEKYLNKPVGSLIMDTGYTEFRDYLGWMTLKPAGYQENGGVYLQPICWKMIADSISKNSAEMAYDIQTLLPYRNKAVDGRGEPYMLFNSYSANPDNYRYGTPGQSWRTATSQCFVNVMIRYIFGVSVELNGIKLKPCIPDGWDKCKITKEVHGASYDIEYTGCGCEIEKILVNGKEYTEEFLPDVSGESYKITVYMK